MSPSDPASRGAISWMARNPVAANLLLLTFIIGGLIMAFRVQKEVFPQIDMDVVLVTVAYPGASPAEVEQGILLSIEENTRTLDGVKEVRSTAMEGAGMVQLEFEIGTERDRALSDVKNAVDRIASFPVDIERPLVSLVDFRVEAIDLVLYGDVEDQVLHGLSERIRDDLLRLEEVNYVEIQGLSPLEISVEVPRDTLRTYGLTLDGIATTIGQTAMELPGGGVKTSAGEVLLRMAERRNHGQDFADIPVVSGEDGRPVRLGDIATIRDGFEETDITGYYNGQRGVGIDIYSVGEQSPLEVAEAVKQYLERSKETLPPGINLQISRDLTEMFRDRLDLLIRNALFGLVLVLILLGLFLEPRLAFWVTMGIPTSFLGSIMFLPWFDVSINMISLFAFIVTLGMVVDDAIVVGENTYRLRQEGMSPLRAAIAGAKQMATPVFFSIATTVAAFFPLLFMPGMRGKFSYAIPVVVILVLLISLTESFLVLPNHLGHVKATSPSDGPLGLLFKLQAYVSRGLERYILKVYRPSVLWCVSHPLISVSVAIFVFMTTMGFVMGGRISVIDFPKEESDRVVVNVRLPFGISVEETKKVSARLVETARATLTELGGGGEVDRGIMSVVGASWSRSESQTGSHLCMVRVFLVPSDQRPFGSSQMADEWRKKFGAMPGVEAISFQSTMNSGDKPIDIELSHQDTQTLETAAEELARKLEGFSGVIDVDNGVELGKPQWDFKLSDDGAAAGLTSASIARQVRSSFYGSLALRQQRGRNEVKVMVRLPRSERETLGTVENLVLLTQAGVEIPLATSAETKKGRAYTTIQRTDGRRTLRVKADVIEGQANPSDVVAKMIGDELPELAEKYPGLGYAKSGRQKDMQELMDFLKYGFLVALLFVFVLIAIPLGSYLQPILVVMMAIPFGYIGAVWGHLLMGMDLSTFSFMGIVALAGVVVNDSIVLVTAANEFRDQGMGIVEAAEEAAARRFRPIMLTTVTTFGGLSPMIFETSLQAKMIIPMAVALGFGILVSTVFVMLVVPTLFVLVERLRGIGGRSVIHGQRSLDGGTP